MSMTLNLCDHLLSQGRHFHSLGVDERALRTFTHLARLRELPPGVADETQFYLAELLLKQRKFAKARRHLAACLAHDPNDAECQYLMAYAHQEDRRGNRGLALEHYRLCIKLDPENALYHCDAGLFAMNQGEVEEGLCWLCRAAELAAEDPDLLGEVVRGLQDHGHLEEARAIARTAMFHNNRDGRFVRLWNDLRFQEVHQQQQRADKRHVIRRAVAEGRVCLPFQQMTVETPSGRKLVRQDGPAGTPAPHLLRFARMPDRKHA
jgi:tetratricopeptide (TPR) repeat protein